MIADFGTPYRQWGVNWKWFGKNPPDWKNVRILFKRFFFSEYFLSLNPLHSIWDEWSPLRRHPRYMRQHSTRPGLFFVNPLFWRWLAVDQLFHVLSNALLAWIVVSRIG